ncbi:hypothetical protein M440DRAFT_1463014 [Trichoderma longibrachiatum ATCC 18648]|uniref:Uncharacterized protein n=1 Tax=Trichoderma longibrachiatum ATCC 18648 TaxID=983965 RepID=A0A2T4C3U5_TRILO|nr:hypothetical protein M440DRAFT_1463014 [Trichoderma longibrachiatum ATCC 18648]
MADTNRSLTGLANLRLFLCIVGIAKAINITIVEIASIKHKIRSHAGILYRRLAGALADLLKDPRPASMLEHPDDHIYHIKDMLLGKADASQDSEAWLRDLRLHMELT